MPSSDHLKRTCYQRTAAPLAAADSDQFFLTNPSVGHHCAADYKPSNYFHKTLDLAALFASSLAINLVPNAPVSSSQIAARFFGITLLPIVIAILILTAHPYTLANAWLGYMRCAVVIVVVLGSILNALVARRDIDIASTLTSSVSQGTIDVLAFVTFLACLSLFLCLLCLFFWSLVTGAIKDQASAGKKPPRHISMARPYVTLPKTNKPTAPINKGKSQRIVLDDDADGMQLPAPEDATATDAFAVTNNPLSQRTSLSSRANARRQSMVHRANFRPSASSVHSRRGIRGSAGAASEDGDDVV